MPTGDPKTPGFGEPGKLELANCEAHLLREIKDRKMKRADIALSYRLALQSSEWRDVDWKKVNEAIISRWSPSGLNWIKTKAWGKPGRA